jgi:hypothetical protein
MKIFKEINFRKIRSGVLQIKRCQDLWVFIATTLLSPFEMVQESRLVPLRINSQYQPLTTRRNAAF